MKERFNKKNLGRKLWERIALLGAEYGFDSNDGTDQVKNRSLEANRAYGEWNALRELAEEWDL